MNHDRLAAIRSLAEKLRADRADEDIDYARMTAPCGLPCFACYLHLAGRSEELRTLIAEAFVIAPEQAACMGCRNEGGRCAHLPIDCRLYPCAQDKGVQHCCECGDFPCDLLHPYADQAHLWHNTKVFNLCLIKKMGLTVWAHEKAPKVLDVYSYEKWRL